MWRIPHLLHAIKKGPHGTAACGAVVAVPLNLAALLTGMVYTPLLIPALAVAVCSLTLLLALTIVLSNRLRAKVNDVHYAISLESGLRRAGYKVNDFFTDEAAGSPSLQLFNWKVLRLCRPRRILELGSGQTTKLLSSYVRENPSAYALTLEQDGAWVRRLKGEIVHDYRSVPLDRREFVCQGTRLPLTTDWYGDIPELRGQFDYILVDGPDSRLLGTAHTNYARAGILQYLPAILAESFVVVFDDADRYGEAMTIRAFTAILRACRIGHIEFAIHGVKTQVVLCSPDLAYLRSV